VHRHRTDPGVAARAQAFVRLLQWLGPWAPPHTAPSGTTSRVIDSERASGQAPLRVFVYAPVGRNPIGALLVAHGLHPKGPEDARLDRFMRILANAGFVAVVPALPDFMQLRCDANVAADFKCAFDALRALPECPVATPGVLSISFGSYPALSLMCDPQRAQQVSGGVIFGGYGDPIATLRYTIGERDPNSPEPDPLSVPAVAINLVNELPLDAGVRTEVTKAWLAFARATWGYPDMREPSAHAPIANDIARTLAPEARTLFLRGCGLELDSREFLLSALAHSHRLAQVDPRPNLRNLRRPLHLMHGRDDDVIPCTEVQTLMAACPEGADVTPYLTGLFAHTGTSALGNLVALAQEAATLMRMIDALVRVATATA
jgi:pimeloyl-ACP methyl ester carboxylesterase